jgi:hypothetical protein
MTGEPHLLLLLAVLFCVVFGHLNKCLTEHQPAGREKTVAGDMSHWMGQLTSSPDCFIPQELILGIFELLKAILSRKNRFDKWDFHQGLDSALTLRTA